MEQKIALESKRDDIFQEIYHETLQNGGNVLMSYFGGFSHDLVSSFADEVEHIMKRKNAPKTVAKRMFTVMIEGLQNICIHGSGVIPGKVLGHIMLIEKENGYLVSFGNFVDSEKMESLTQQLNRVNGMNSSELKELYLKTLSQGVLSEDNGAGLGIITIALKFNSKMNGKFRPYDKNLYYYSLEVHYQ